MKPYLTIMKVCQLLEKNCSFSTIRQSTGLGAGTIALIRDRKAQLNLSWAEMMQSDPRAVEDLFYPPQNRKTAAKPLPDFQQIYERIHRSQAASNLFVEWELYKAANPERHYQYSQFVHHFNQWCADHRIPGKVRMRKTRVPGQALYIDWCGDRIAVVRNSSYIPGEEDEPEFLEAHFLVTTVGVSSKIFVWAVPDEKTPSFLMAMDQAVHFYGRLPELFVPDNMRVCVTSNDGYDVVLNRSFEDFCLFYDTPAVPAAPLTPRAKATVENAVRTVEQRLMSQLVDRRFSSFE